MKKLTPLLLAVGLLAAALPAAHANLVVVAPTEFDYGQFIITDPISFTINRAGTGRLFVLDDWVTFDGERTDTAYYPQLSLSINGVPTLIQGAGFVDNPGFADNAVSENDGFFVTGVELGLNVGDTVTLNPASYGLDPVAGFNPMANQDFPGNIFITDGNGVQLSDTVSVSGVVPEPSTYALALAGGLGLLGIARRQRHPLGLRV